MRPLIFSLLHSLTFVVLASSAHAQACPDGARGHAFPGPGPQANGYCAPFRCHADADCGGGGMHCVELPMCIGHLAGHPHEETAWHQCGAHNACNTGEHCEQHARVCTSTAPPTPPPPGPSAHSKADGPRPGATRAGRRGR